LLFLIGVFKNEALNLAEWIDSHVAEGVDRIVLVNNNSTDDFESAIASARHANRVTVLSDDRIHAQQQIYNDTYQNHIKNSDCEWLIVCDLDEFFYSRNGFNAIPDYLSTVPDNISSISIPWKIFGSSGFDAQPRSGVVRNFTWRDKYPDDCPKTRVGMACPGWMSSKYIVRNRSVEWLGNHNATLLDGQAILSNSDPCDKDSLFQPISESLLAAMNIHVNHYAIQSRQYYRTIKMTRGSVSSANSAELYKSTTYFQLFDQNILSDCELARKHRPAALPARI